MIQSLKNVKNSQIFLCSISLKTEHLKALLWWIMIRFCDIYNEKKSLISIALNSITIGLIIYFCPTLYPGIPDESVARVWSPFSSIPCLQQRFIYNSVRKIFTLILMEIIHDIIILWTIILNISDFHINTAWISIEHCPSMIILNCLMYKHHIIPYHIHINNMTCVFMTITWT